MTHQSQQTALHEFFRWESLSWVGVVADIPMDEKVYFMPVKNVQSYFTSNDSRKLNKILVEIFNSEYPPIDSELILRDHTAIFCILLRLGQGKLIEHFACYEELSDRRLPFDPSQPPREFPTVDQDDSFLQRFCEKQKMYCVPILDSHMIHKHFARQRLLPITSHELHGSQSVGSQYVVTIYGPHNKLLPLGTDTQNPYNHTFVLKRYSKENEALYKQEVDDFRSVRHAESIIRFYGSFIHGDEFNILLEFADKGSLEDYFKRETPPSRGVDIIKFWEALFLLIKGLKAIHSVRLGHHDVKPESILVVSNGSDTPSQWNFKFANVGVSHSKAGPPEDRVVPKETETCSTYDPPESYSPSHDDRAEKRSSKVNWSADIWSLGAIYSEAAMWIADGYKGLQEYRRQRIAETDRILFKGGDCFNDGEKVLQSVLDAHADIEDRLRRSDYITKDVLDSMVDEMLWDEDRPNAKALWRKAGMVSSRARQRMSVNSGDEFSQSGSSQSRALPLPRIAAPTAPLPPLPRGAQGLSSIAERQYPPNMEKWRSHVGELQISTASQASGPVSAIASPFPSQQTTSTESVSEFDRDVTGSVASWNVGDGASSIASPPTQYSSPHASVQYDFSRHNSNEGRPRVMRTSYEYRSPPRKPVSSIAYTNASDISDNASVAPPSLQNHSVYAQDRIPPPASHGGWTTGSVISERSEPLPTPQRQEPKAPSRTPSQANSHSSGVSSQPSEAPARPKSQKWNGGFSLFPSKTWNNNSAFSNIRRSIEKASSHHSDENIPRSMIVRSSISESLPSLPAFPDHFEYLSLNTCYEWKMAQKKMKKNSEVPPLPGAAMLEDLNNRDHVFIIDDSASMSSVWADVKRVFETLSYVLKGMSPDGTELFFTIAYDTWRRKDTHDLVMYLDKKTCRGVTNISHRLDLQLQTYRVRLHNEKKAVGVPVKKGKEVPPVRPMSFYILTNGEWGPGPDVKVAIQTTVDFLQKERIPPGKVTIEFISFAQSAGAMQKMNELAQKDFGMDIVDCTRWTGNVLRMLKGPMNKSLFNEIPNQDTSEMLVQTTSPAAESSHTLVYARDVINELA